ncbi:MAG: hypothetical protein ACYCOU_26240 [Sulfobacillus sp.]
MMNPLVSIDCGYGETKAWTPRIEQQVIAPLHFPSMVSPHHENLLAH